jgi:subtilisin-like proprotein convertase family protein
MMRLVKALVIALGILGGFAALSPAAPHTIRLAAGEPELTLVEQQDSYLQYRVAITEIEGMDVATREGTFTRLMIPGFHASQREGAPQLPMMNRLIEVPYGATPRIEVISSTTRVINLSDYGITNPVFPAQPSMPKNADPAAWPFVYDRSAYNVPRVAQDLTNVVDLGQMRGVRIGRLELSPVEYYPLENRIVVHDAIEFRVRFDGGDRAAEAALKANTASPFFAPVYGYMDGYRDLHDTHPDLVRDVVTMVVITPPQFAAQLQSFVAWKTRRGFNTILAQTGTPPVGSTTAEIKAYITSLYNNGTPQQPAPSFILFVGDTNLMPTWTQSGDPTDRPYCDLTGDLPPEIYYGRWSVTNATQLQAIIDKTMMYDQFTMPDPSYLSEVVMIGGMDSSHGQVWANGQINYGTTYYFNEAHDILSHTYLYPNSGSQEAAIIANLNHGVSYANYTAHGSENSWSDPVLSVTDVYNLTNTNKYFTGVGNCCLTSKYDYSGECLAEAMIRATQKGAVGYIGGSNLTYWDEDYYWGVGYTTNIVEHPTYEASGEGAYDGAFHDRANEVNDMNLWYVTNDAIVFCGNLAVTESGSSRITYYWNIYNLMGDPSISTFMGAPGFNPVTHPSTVFTTWTSIPVTGTPGSYVGLTKDGVIIGAGTIGTSGSLELPIWANPLTPGIAHLVVMAQNKVPYQTDLTVIVPAVVRINPNTIDANVQTSIDVGVYEYDGLTPKPGVEVWAAGLNYQSTHATTGANGHCTLSVLYPFGPSLDIVGKMPAEPWELFRVPITVRAQALTNPNLWVTTGVGLNDTFAMNLPGVIHSTVGEPNATLWAFLNGTELAHTTNPTLEVTPNATGSVEGIIAVSGYNLYRETFPVIVAYGTISGHVDANGTAANGAVVTCRDGLGNQVFQVQTNVQGNYAVTTDIPVAPYTITCDYFGFLHWEEPYFLNYGPNVLNINLVPAPSGILSGLITETGTGAPLQADVKIYRADTMALYAQTTSSPTDGSYATPSLPYFNYVVKVKAWHHIPANLDLTVNQPAMTHDFVLDPTIGDLLLIDDGAKAGGVASKVDEKTGREIAPGYTAEDSKAAADIKTDLENLGYTVTMEAIGVTNPATWSNYDLVICSSGGNTTSLNNATVRAALVSFVQSGGHLLIEGGEVGYDWDTEDVNFAQTVLHVTAWTHDSSGNVQVAMPSHYVVSVPNVIASPISMTYAGYGDEDALTVMSNAQKVAVWTSYTSDGSIICYDTNPAPAGGQIVFFAFNYSAMNATARPLLMQNAVTWLMTPEFGNCSVSGRITLLGQTDHSGVKVEAIPNGGFVYTDASGAYTLPNLFPGTYTIKASKDGWAIGQQQVTLTDGQNMTNVDFFLGPVYVVEQCRQPNLTIPDNAPAGVSDPMRIAADAEAISSVEVYINITHTYIGDLIVKLTSPAGTVVTLHNRTGSSSDNIIGWYPTQLTPAQSLDAFIGQDPDGVWVLNVSDVASSDVGVLNQWCLRITYSRPVADVEGGSKPSVLALQPNFPNPVSSMTAIRFDLPHTGHVDLGVFDVAGRRVATLVGRVVSAGRHEVVWNARDDRGRAAASGMYFYRLTTDGKTLTKRLTVVR